MIHKIKDIILDLSKLKNVYPASVVEYNGDISEMSLEWTEINEDKVKILKYILVFDFISKDDKNIKETINFNTKDELIQEMIKVSKLLS